MPGIAVAGAGSAALALAADMTLRGFKVNIGVPAELGDRLRPVVEQGGIRLSGVAGDCLVQPHRVTTDMEALVRGVSIIFIAVPAYRHEMFMRTLADCLEDGQYVVFASYFSAIRCSKLLRELNVQKDVVPVETQSLICAARRTGPAAVHVFSIKKSLPVVAVPLGRTEGFLKRITPIYEQMTPAAHVLLPGLNNIGGVMHSVLTLLNAGRIESSSPEDWNLYADGATEAVVKVMLALDRERIAVAGDMGVIVTPLVDIFARFAGGETCPEETLSHVIRTNPVFNSPAVRTPDTLRNRFTREDIPYALVPWSSMARSRNLPVPVIDSLIRLGSVMTGRDYENEGVTVDDLEKGMGGNL